MMTKERRAIRLGGALVCAMLGGCGDDATQHAHDEARLARLLVSDGIEGKVTVVDLGDGAVAGTLALTAPATLNAGPGKRFAYAHQTDEGLVQIIDSGVSVISHGDHAHVDVYPPVVLDFALAGASPIHFTHHDGQSVVFFDGALALGQTPAVPARAVIVPEVSLLQGMPEAISIMLDVPHHGVAVPVGNGLVVTSDVPAPEGEWAPLPNGVSATDWDGSVSQVFDASCPALHGEVALTDDRLAFACASHVLVVERVDQSAPFTTRVLAYPDSRRAWALAASNDGTFVFADHADETHHDILRIDVETGSFAMLHFDVAVSEFAVVPGLDARLLVLTVDGVLHVVDTTTLEMVHAWDAVSPFVASFESPHPDLAVANDLAYVSDTSAGRVYEFHVADLGEGRRFDVGGTPASIVVLGPATVLEDAHEH